MGIYENHRMSDPRLPFIFHITRFPANKSGGAGNWHENVEILSFTEGSGTVTSNETRLSVHAGDIVILNANCLHTISSIEPMHYYCLIVDRSFCVENHFDTNKIRFEPLVRDTEVASCLETLAQDFRSDPQEPYRIQLIRSRVLYVMALLCRRYSNAEDTPTADSHLLSALKQAIGYIHANFDRDLSLDAVAERVGLSKFYFAREFRRVTGHTFVSYINMIRCEKAKRLLTEGQLPIGEVGRLCGFTSQSYFTKTFEKQTGLLPRVYRASPPHL